MGIGRGTLQRAPSHSQSSVKCMKNLFLKFCILTGMLLGLPLLGVYLTGLPLPLYLEFPPQTRYITHSPFSPSAFAAYSFLIIVVATFLLLKGVHGWRQAKQEKRHLNTHPFPWWGRLGIVTGLISWTIAWVHSPWSSTFQPYTFVPLWLSFILVINAITYRRSGHCMMVDQPGFFLLLFPASAAFWWFFEYLNRFVQNWYYVNVNLKPWEYFCHATLSFSTVLPAILGTREWLIGTSWLQKGFKSLFPLNFVHSKILAGFVLVLSGIGLSGIGRFPNYLFPLLWISPLLIIVSFQILTGESHIFSATLQGDWRPLVSSALAALFCGWFWEMWNFYSLAKWEYSIPFVNRYKIFEMPVLGYAGYLPFGLECAAIGGILEKLLTKNIQKHFGK